jgi:hypothetical protein
MPPHQTCWFIISGGLKRRRRRHTGSLGRSCFTQRCRGFGLSWYRAVQCCSFCKIGMAHPSEPWIPKCKNTQGYLFPYNRIPWGYRFLSPVLSTAVFSGGKRCYEAGLIQRIGTETATHAWNDNWIPWDYLFHPVPSKKDNPPTHVSSFISVDTMTWNKEEMEEFFHPTDIDQICRIPLSTRKYEDKWLCHYECTACSRSDLCTTSRLIQ